MLVYRVESFSKRGAYTAGVPFPALPGKHPCPTEDTLMMKNGWGEASGCHRYYFGFNSMEQLSEWFPLNVWHHFAEFNLRPSIQECPDKRMGISVYDCPDEDVIVGDTQTVFIMDNAQRVEIIKFEELLNNVIPA